MLRYFFIQKLYPLLSLLAQFYFFCVNRIFGLLYLLKPKSKVEWPEQDVANPLLFMSAKKAAEKIRNKEITSEQLVSAYIGRIQRVQPQINAVVFDCFEQALEEARVVDRYLAELDEQSDDYRNLAETKPLLGVPFSNKNNMDVKGFVTIAAYAPNAKNEPAARDSSVVARLRSAGAILVCLTNLPKLAMNWCTENALHGRTNNPYDLRRIPGGSSGGESALIASGASPFGLGNDLGGSVRIPAFMCGVFGLKPTKHNVPLDGFVPPIETDIGRALWSIGPLCRYAEDLPIVYGAIADKPLAELESPIDFGRCRLLYMDSLNIWFMEKVGEPMRQALKKAVRHFEAEFDIIGQKVDFPLAHHYLEIWGALGWDGTPAKGVPEILKEIPKLMNGTSMLTSCGWIFQFLHAFVAPRNEQEKEFMLQKLEKLRKQLKHALGPEGILLLPVWPTVAPFHGQCHFTPFNLGLTHLINLLGFPSVSCPVGLDSTSGMPLGVQIVGLPHSEPLLMAGAKEIERAFGGWMRP